MACRMMRCIWILTPSAPQVDKDLRALKVDALAAAARFREDGGEDSQEKVRFN